MSASNSVPALPVSSGRPTAVDVTFLLSMVALMALVAFLGRLTFQEGMKTEATKAQAESLANWMKESSAGRSGVDFRPAACAHTASTGSANQWGACKAALGAAGGPLHDARNTFTGEPIGFVERCTPSDLTTAGQLQLDKVSPTPPGSAVPVVVSPLQDDEGIGQKLTVRITICDKGGYAIRVGETEF